MTYEEWKKAYKINSYSELRAEYNKLLNSRIVNGFKADALRGLLKAMEKYFPEEIKND